MESLAQIYEKVASAVLTIPTIKNWVVALLLLLIVIVICLPLGLWCKFLEIKMAKISVIKIISILVNRLLFPCLAEELVFRVLLLSLETSYTSTTTRLFLEVVNLIAYVASHPLNAVLFYRRALEIFTHPFFLLSTSVLGIACTITYIESDSIWTPAILHWTVVLAWLIVLDGYSKLGFKENK